MRLRLDHFAPPRQVGIDFVLGDAMGKYHGDRRLGVVVAGKQQHVRRLRQACLDSRGQPRALRTVQPSFHRFVGFEPENRHPFFLQTRDWAKYFGADEAGELARRFRDGRLRGEIFVGLVGMHEVRRDRGRRLWNVRLTRFD